MNKVVLTTPLPDVLEYPNTIASNDIEEWITAIKNNKDKEVNIHSRNEFIENNNWYSRVDTIIDHLYPKTRERCLKEYYDNISVIVLNYNNMKVIFHAVETLLRYNERYHYEIIVVDNQSTDGSYEKLLEMYQDNVQVKIVRNDKNGCASGRNIGVKESSKNYLFFLDSDQWIQNRYFLDNYLALMERIPEVGAIANGAGFFNQLGYSYRAVDSFPYRFMNPNCMARKDIAYLATCGFLIKKELFNKIEGFDEAYDPTCYEDTDLALAVRNSGKEIYYCPYLGAGHLPHQTTKSGTSAHDKLIREKGDYFVAKWRLKNPKLLDYKKG